MPTSLRFPALSFAVLAILWGGVRPSPTAADQPRTAAASKPTDAKKGGEYVRVRRDDKQRPLALETALVRYRGKGELAGAQVDLIGAIHVGERSYYEKLNQLFTEYDALLFELVAPEGFQIKPGERLESQSPVGALQTGLQGILGLEFQLEQIDYSKANFVHADMSPEEFARTMKERGESFVQMLLRMLGQGMAMQGQSKAQADNTELLFALIRRDRPAMKRVLAEQLEGMEGALNVLGAADGSSTIVTERNKKALSVLRTQLGAGKKRIGIFYGAGHLPDMDERLRSEFGLERVETTWLSAWDLAADHAHKPAAAGSRE